MCPIRVGVNAGSLDKDLLEKYGAPVPQALVDSALKEIRLSRGRRTSTTSRSRSSTATCRRWSSAYRLLADTVDYPLHLGVTEAGPPPGGLIKSVAGIATLLLEGIGDTIRFSLTADPVEEAEGGQGTARVSRACGSARVSISSPARRAAGPRSTSSRLPRRPKTALEAEKLPIQVAVMGCVVNGPGEAREADIGIAAGKGKGHLFIKGQVVRVVPEAEMVEALVDEARKLVAEGVEARLAAADAGAAAVATETAIELRTLQGDANHAAERRAAVAEVASGE